MPAKSVGLIAHVGKPGAAELVRKLQEEFRKRSVQLLLESQTATLVGGKSAKTTAELGSACEILVVLGGDGSILKALHDLGDSIKPVFGINIGSLGFLTTLNSTACARAVESIAAGDYTLSRRTLLDVSVQRGGKIIATRVGLNDAVVSRGSVSRLIRLETRIDGAVLTEYNADGLIIATPTGSTAYSLSAGGPVLMPDSGVFAITPICPHVLTNRTAIVSDRAQIEIIPCGGHSQVFVTVDGQEVCQLAQQDVVRVCRSSRELPLVMLPEMKFLEVLRQKLKWSGSAV
jgi:NAD+ kinase